MRKAHTSPIHTLNIYKGEVSVSLAPTRRLSHSPIALDPTPFSLAHLSLPHSPSPLSPSQRGSTPATAAPLLLPSDGGASPSPLVEAAGAAAEATNLVVGCSSTGGVLLPRAPPPTALAPSPASARSSPELLHRRWHTLLPHLLRLPWWPDPPLVARSVTVVAGSAAGGQIEEPRRRRRAT